MALFYVDVASQKLVKIDESNRLKNDEFYWEISDYDWSPDSRWICYTQVQPNRNSQVFIYSLEQNRHFAASGDFFDNLNPAFDANGSYLYYLSSRNFSVQMDFYEDNHIIDAPQQVMLVQLRAGEKPPFAEEEESKTEEKKGGSEPLVIQTDGLAGRTFPLPVTPGNYFYLKAGKGKVLWCSVPKFTERNYDEIFKPASQTKWDLHIFDVREKKEVVLNEPIAAYSLSTNGEQSVAAQGQRFLPDHRCQGVREQEPRPESEPLRHGLRNRLRPGVAADLQRHLALVPRFLL